MKNMIKNKLTITCISDTHGRHDKVIVPKCDVLIHAGDLTGRGTLSDVKKFAKWIKKQPATHKLVLAGNHDWPFQLQPKEAQDLLKDSCTYLQDSEVTIDGIKFYGMPWSPRFGNWAFYFERGSKEIYDKCQAIPSDTSILITHGPPYGYLDLTSQQIHAGCQTIRNRLYDLSELKGHVFGHIHEGFLSTHDKNMGVTFINASICDLNYNPTNKPIVIEVSKD
jgi:Icc-related predicted phosphoesterase